MPEPEPEPEPEKSKSKSKNRKRKSSKRKTGKRKAKKDKDKRRMAKAIGDTYGSPRGPRSGHIRAQRGPCPPGYLEGLRLVPPPQFFCQKKNFE